MRGPDVVVGKNNEEGRIFGREVRNGSHGRGFPMAAVLESGLDVGIAKDCAYDSHLRLCWSSSSSRKRYPAPPSLWYEMKG